MDETNWLTLTLNKHLTFSLVHLSTFLMLSAIVVAEQGTNIPILSSKLCHSIYLFFLFSVWGSSSVALELTYSLSLIEISSKTCSEECKYSIWFIAGNLWNGKDLQRDACAWWKESALWVQQVKEKHQSLAIGHLVELGLPSHITSAYCFNQCFLLLDIYHWWQHVPSPFPCRYGLSNWFFFTPLIV